MHIEKTTIKVKKTHVFLVAMFIIIFVTVSMIISAYREYAANAPIPVADESAIRLIQFDPPAENAPSAIISTSAGDICITLYPNEAPEAVRIFTEAAESGVYEGGLAGINELGTYFTFDAPETGEFYKKEIHDNLWTFKGAVCMTEGKDLVFLNTVELTEEEKEFMSSGGELAIVKNAFVEHGGIPNFVRQYAVFGQVIEGMDVLERIAQSSSETIISLKSITIEYPDATE